MLTRSKRVIAGVGIVVVSSLAAAGYLWRGVPPRHPAGARPDLFCLPV